MAAATPLFALPDRRAELRLESCALPGLRPAGGVGTVIGGDAGVAAAVQAARDLVNLFSSCPGGWRNPVPLHGYRLRGGACAQCQFRTLGQCPLFTSRTFHPRRVSLEGDYRRSMHTEGSAALVSGGASGLGEATVRRLAAAGAEVTICDVNAKLGAGLAGELSQGSGRVRFVRCDVTDSHQVAEAVAVAAEHAPLRICVNCAGIGVAARTVARDGTPHDYEQFMRVININLVGTFNTLRYSASAMARNEPRDDGERGVIINTASIAAYEGQIGQLAYAASKGAIVGMTLPAARDLSTVGIRVVSIAPGFMDTPLIGMLPPALKEALGAGVPFPKRLGLPDDFAQLAMHIVENRYLNGEVIRLDGAFRMPPK